MTAKTLGYGAAAGSAALLLAAFVFQLLGYAPCTMCIWQRYPHAVAIVAGVLLAFGFAPILMLTLGALSAAATSGLGLFHTGVERDWWDGPAACSGSGLDLNAMSIDDLLPSTATEVPRLVMCDEVVWEFLTLSMASWNAIWSAVLAVVWIWALVTALGRSAGSRA